MQSGDFVIFDNVPVSVRSCVVQGKGLIHLRAQNAYPCLSLLSAEITGMHHHAQLSGEFSCPLY